MTFFAVLIMVLGSWVCSLGQSGVVQILGWGIVILGGSIGWMAAKRQSYPLAEMEHTPPRHGGVVVDARGRMYVRLGRRNTGV